jgi:hypothetical protein
VPTPTWDSSQVTFDDPDVTFDGSLIAPPAAAALLTERGQWATTVVTETGERVIRGGTVTATGARVLTTTGVHYSVTLPAAVIFATSLTRKRPTKFLPLELTLEPEVAFSVGLVRSTTVTFSPAISRGHIHPKTLAVTATYAPAIARKKAVGKIASTGVTYAAAIRRQVGRTLNTAVTFGTDLDVGSAPSPFAIEGVFTANLVVHPIWAKVPGVTVTFSPALIVQADTANTTSLTLATAVAFDPGVQKDIAVTIPADVTFTPDYSKAISLTQDVEVVYAPDIAQTRRFVLASPLVLTLTPSLRPGITLTRILTGNVVLVAKVDLDGHWNGKLVYIDEEHVGDTESVPFVTLPGRDSLPRGRQLSRR